jgi:recombination protein RecA
MAGARTTPKNKTAKKAADAKDTLTKVKDNKSGKNSNAQMSAEAVKYLQTMEKKGMLGDINKAIDFVPTGLWVGDRCIGDGKGGNGEGGFPRGFMSEVSGMESTGKTTLCLQAIPGLQRQGLLTVYADFEKSLRAQQHYLRALGVDTRDKSTFIHLEPDTLEEGAEAIFEACIALKPALVIVDSVAAMIPSAFLTGKVDEATQLGLHARQMSVFVGTMNKILSRTNTALVFVNQLRAKIGGMGNGPKTDTTGGFAFKFYMTVRIQLAQIHKVSSESVSAITGKSGKEVTDQLIKLTVIKNKIDKAFRSEEVYLKFGYGFDGLRSMVELAIKKKILAAAGSWLSYVSDTNPSLNFKLQGKDSVRSHLEAHPEVVEDMMPFLFPEVDIAEFIAAKKAGEVEDEYVQEDLQDLLKAMSEGFSGTDENAPLELPED